MKSKLAALLLACIGLGSSAAAMAQTFTLSVSPTTYNRLVFPSPYAKVVIPPEAQLAERPLPMVGDTGLLVRPKKNADPIPVFVELKNGVSFTVLLKTDDTQSSGGVFRFHDAPDQSAAPNHVVRANDSFIADSMVAAAEGKTPDGMSKVKDGAGYSFTLDKSDSDCHCKPDLTLEPVASYRGSRHWVRVYRMHSTQLVEVDPRDFWRKGVVAISAVGDVVSPASAPLIIIMERDND